MPPRVLQQDDTLFWVWLQERLTAVGPGDRCPHRTPQCPAPWAGLAAQAGPLSLARSCRSTARMPCNVFYNAPPASKNIRGQNREQQQAPGCDG